jgi:hypothetical protein
MTRLLQGKVTEIRSNPGSPVCDGKIKTPEIETTDTSFAGKNSKARST